MKKQEVTDNQKELLKKLVDGWRLVYMNMMDGRFFLRKAGNNSKVYAPTCRGLIKKGYIKQVKDKFPVIEYRITEKGKKEAESVRI